MYNPQTTCTSHHLTARLWRSQREEVRRKKKRLFLTKESSETKQNKPSNTKKTGWSALSELSGCACLALLARSSTQATLKVDVSYTKRCSEGLYVADELFFWRGLSAFFSPARRGRKKTPDVTLMHSYVATYIVAARCQEVRSFPGLPRCVKCTEGICRGLTGSETRRREKTFGTWYAQQQGAHAAMHKIPLRKRCCLSLTSLAPLNRCTRAVDALFLRFCNTMIPRKLYILSLCPALGQHRAQRSFKEISGGAVYAKRMRPRRPYTSVRMFSTGTISS